MTRPSPRPSFFTLASLVASFVICGFVRADKTEADGKIHVTYWEKWVGFEAVATAGGDPPDIAGLWTQNVTAYADAEALTPFDDFIRRDGFTPDAWLSRYYPVYAHICTHAGHVYAGIATPAVLALHWNKTMFRDAGLDPERPPRTLAELDDYSRRLTKRDPKTNQITQVGFLPQEPGWWPWVFCSWFGGKLFDGKQITLGTDPRNLEAMRWVASYTNQLGLDDLRRFRDGFGQQASSQAPFFVGKVAMIIQGVWFNNYIRQYKPGLDYGVGPWPEAAPGLKDFAMAEADVLVIPRGAKNPQAAWEFIKYVNSSNAKATRREELEGAELVCFLQAKNSPMREWSPFFAEHHPHPHIAIFRELSASPHATSVPDVGLWNEYDREMMALFEKIRLLDVTPEKGINYAQKRMSASWAGYRRSLERHGQLATSTPGDP